MGAFGGQGVSIWRPCVARGNPSDAVLARADCYRRAHSSRAAGSCFPLRQLQSPAEFCSPIAAAGSGMDGKKDAGRNCNMIEPEKLIGKATQAGQGELAPHGLLIPSTFFPATGDVTGDARRFP